MTRARLMALDLSWQQSKSLCLSFPICRTGLRLLHSEVCCWEVLGVVAAAPKTQASSRAVGFDTHMLELIRRARRWFTRVPAKGQRPLRPLGLSWERGEKEAATPQNRVRKVKAPPSHGGHLPHGTCSARQDVLDEGCGGRRAALGRGTGLPEAPLGASPPPFLAPAAEGSLTPGSHLRS